MNQESKKLENIIKQKIINSNNWIGFDEFMNLALYYPNLGYYSNEKIKFGLMPESGSDFVTAPQISPIFGQLLTNQIIEAFEKINTKNIYEFGAGNGILAKQILDELKLNKIEIDNYFIIDLSLSLKEQQKQTLNDYSDKIIWLNNLPKNMNGIIIGNEVLDSMPVKLLNRINNIWYEKGISLNQDNNLIYENKKTNLKPPIEISGNYDYLTEIHLQSQGFIRTLSDHLDQGTVFLIDYGFSEKEYYHEQRNMGTLVCHKNHLVDLFNDNIFMDIGFKDITAHVNFTDIVLSAQNVNFDILGFINQANFLINCGFEKQFIKLNQKEKIMAEKLILEHEMGELFKVIGFSKGIKSWFPLGFSFGDKTHKL